MNNIEKLKNLMASIFKIDASLINENSNPDSIESWDSLKHMNLIVALEELFEIRFDDEEIIELISYPLIKLSLEEKGIIL